MPGLFGAPGAARARWSRHEQATGLEHFPFFRFQGRALAAHAAGVAGNAVVEIGDVSSRVPLGLLGRRVVMAVVAGIGFHLVGIVMASRAIIVAAVVGHREHSVFELGAIPRVRRVAFGAFGAEAALVDLRLGVAGGARLRRAQEGNIVLVAGPAVGGLMSAGQFEGR